MKKFYVVLGVVALLIVVILFYASVWGENKKIDVTVDEFFKSIQEQKYQIACNRWGTENLFKVNAKSGIDPDRVFALELVLLKYFSLLDYSNYTIKIRKEEMWFPYINTDSISVDLQLIGKQENNFDFSMAQILAFFQPQNDVFLKDFLHIKRDDGYWKINDIDIENENISADYDRILQEISLAKYITTQNNITTLHNMNFKKDGMSLEKKRISLYILNKFEEIIRTEKEQQAVVSGKN